MRENHAFLQHAFLKVVIYHVPFDRRFGIIPALKCHHFLFNAANSYFTLLKTSKEKEVLIYSKREKYLKCGNEIFYDIIYFTVLK